MLSRGKNGRLVFSMDTVSDVLVTIIILTVLIFCYVIGTLIVFSVIITIQSHNVIMS